MGPLKVSIKCEKCVNGDECLIMNPSKCKKFALAISSNFNASVIVSSQFKRYQLELAASS